MHWVELRFCFSPISSPSHASPVEVSSRSSCPVSAPQTGRTCTAWGVLHVEGEGHWLTLGHGVVDIMVHE